MRLLGRHIIVPFDFWRGQQPFTLCRWDRNPYGTPEIQIQLSRGAVGSQRGLISRRPEGPIPFPATKKEAHCSQERRAEIVLKNWEEPEPVTGSFQGRL